MKRILGLLMMCLLLVGCSSGDGKKESNLSMNSFIEAYESEGIEVDPNEQPMFQMIGAKDGVIFYNENQPVKIYEFASEKDIKNVQKEFPAMSEWERNGLFFLETNDEKAKSVFNNVE